MPSRHPARACSARAAFPALAILVALHVPAVPCAGQSAPLHRALPAGPHDVGFERLWELDRSRVWPRAAAIDSVEGPLARPLRIDVWYPAVCDGPDRMPLRSYVEMESPSAAFDDLVFLTRRWDEYSYRGLAGDSASYDRLVETPTAVCATARAAPGRFPLVVYSAGWYNRAPDNTVLAEHLASQGFVVATVPQLNPGLWTFEFASDATSVENQVRDLEVAVGALLADPRVDRTRLGAMGYSTGGDVALLLADRNPLVDAVVGLDASWSLGSGNDVAGSSLFRPEGVTVPVLAARRPPSGDDPPALRDDLLVALTASPRLVVDVPGADHGTFSDDPPQRWYLAGGDAGALEPHAAVARAVLLFLRGTLDGEGAPDGPALARQLRTDGLDARFIPARGEAAGGG